MAGLLASSDERAFALPAPAGHHRDGASRPRGTVADTSHDPGRAWDISEQLLLGLLDEDVDVREWMDD